MYKPSFRSPLLPLLITGLFAAPIAGRTQTASSCEALVQVTNNLWLVKADGSPIAQVTNDAQFKTAAALNPSGNLIAFAGKDAPMDVTLVDAGGRLVGDVDLKASDAITGLKWLNPNLLSAQEHVGPEASRYHFVQLGAANAVTVLQVPAADGSSCAASPSANDVACLVGAVAVELNGRRIYTTPSVLPFATTVEQIDAAVGTSVTTSTSPQFRVDVGRISAGNVVQLRVTTADGLWTEQYVPAGDALNVAFSDTTDATPRYAVLPTVTSNTGVVRLAILRLPASDYALEGGIAWDPRGKRMAVVAVSPGGQRSWLLLNKEMGQAAAVGTGAIDANEPLPIAGPVQSIAFTSDTHLRIVGASQVFDKDIPAQGKVPSGGAYTLSSALPQKLTVNVGGTTAVVDVKGWSCR
jgi:hypothetical protein